MINFMYMLNNTVKSIFEEHGGKWQRPIGTDGQPTERKALLVLLRVNKKGVSILFHAPANYVGVYEKTGDKPWTCMCYHDSCWRDSLERYLWEHKDADIRFDPFPQSKKGLNIITSITKSILVIFLTEEELKTLKVIRDKKYK